MTTRKTVGLASTLLALAALAFVVVNNSVQPEIQVIAGDGEVYGSVAELRSNSDLVVSGRIGSVVESYVDSAGEPAVDERGDELPGLPKLIISLEVEAITEGDPPGGTVYLVTADNTGVFTDWDPTFRPGEHVVVFLFEIPPNAPNMSPELAERVEKYGSLYGLVGGSQGVFDVIGDSARSRFEDAPLEITNLE